MSERWSLTIVKANLSFSFGLYFVYTSIVLYAGLRLLHLTVAQILYTMHVLIEDIFTAQIFANMF